MSKWHQYKMKSSVVKVLFECLFDYSKAVPWLISFYKFENVFTKFILLLYTKSWFKTFR